ncbi:MAG: insulinase family protein [Ruminococcaceae bacterium]|nr:insulinase family protein [Oscillospiraceae bacterium]
MIFLRGFPRRIFNSCGFSISLQLLQTIPKYTADPYKKEIFMNFKENGVSYKHIPSKRFKTTLLSVTFYAPLDKNAAANALSVALMSKGTPEYADYYSFNRRLAGLYGASVTSSVSKTGDRQELNISLTVNDDKYSLGGEPTVSAAGQLLLDMLFGYYLSGKSYPKNAVTREKRLIKEAIMNRFNDKRVFARRRCEEIMCDGEAYGLSPNGTVEEVEALTDSDIRSGMTRLLKEAFISIVTVGAKEPTCFIEDFKKLITTVGRNYHALPEDVAKKASELKVTKEKMPVKQGKLVMGFRSEVGENLPESVKTWIMTDIFGGGPYSKLFCNVREKMSLCYYCAARGVRTKGLIFIESGVEKDNIESARTAILDQFQNIKNGQISESEINSSKLSLSDAFRSLAADQGSLASWYDARALSDNNLSPEDVVNAVEAVNYEDIIAAANTYSLDTVYILSPDEEAMKEDAE